MRAPQQSAQSPRPAPSAGPTTDIGLAMGKLREAVAACQKALSAQHAAASALAASVADMRHIAEDMIATNRQVQKDVSGICTKARAFQLPPVTAD
ncbi:MAG: hypothetical protein EAZ99_09225 [Alphaproteobacteria bacterium]|nr:MAG: hypothetical protein EAZ99_09225 [Alphaproteobacteria bacterium]